MCLKGFDFCPCSWTMTMMAMFFIFLYHDNPTLAPGLIFSRFFENLTIALKKVSVPPILGHRPDATTLDSRKPPLAAPSV